MSKPNFIVFMTDDQGYGDLSCMGATDFRTPHLDRLAASGVRFTNWYSNSPVCSPSRASLLTGRYPGNAGVRAILARASHGQRTAAGDADPGDGAARGWLPHTHGGQVASGPERGQPAQRSRL